MNTRQRSHGGHGHISTRRYVSYSSKSITTAARLKIPFSLEMSFAFFYSMGLVVLGGELAVP